MIPGLEASACDRCGTGWLVPQPGGTCPSCASGRLGPVETGAPASPELVVPHAADAGVLRRQLDAFASGVPFRCPELEGSLLASRARPVFWPQWLADVDASGVFEVEAGFDYQVESSQEVLAGGTWRTQAVAETRTRWEPRVGRVRRRYDNLAVPALGAQETLERRVGPVPLEGYRAFSPDLLAGAAVQVPDRTPEEQWPAAVTLLRAQVGADCARACAADHSRDLRLEVAAERASWTWLLLPGYSTWYADDEGRRHVVLVNGVTGQPGGARLASPAKGRTSLLACGAVAALLLGLALLLALLGLALPVLLLLALLSGALGLGFGLLGLWCWRRPLAWNAGQLGVTGCGSTLTGIAPCLLALLTVFPGCGGTSSPPAASASPPPSGTAADEWAQCGTYDPAETAFPASSPNHNRLLVATSADGLVWRKTGTVVADHADVPDAVLGPDGAVVVHFVSFCAGVRDTVQAKTSTDLLRWTARTVAIEGRSTPGSAVDPDVVRLEDGRYRIYYTVFPLGADGRPGRGRTHHATGSTPYRFTEDGLAFEDAAGGDVLDPSVLRCGAAWRIYAGGPMDRVRTGISPDGALFTQLEDLVLPDPTVRFANGAAVPEGHRFWGFAGEAAGGHHVVSLLSRDDCASWTLEAGERLSLEPAIAAESRSVKDPAVVRLPDGTWAMLYVSRIPGL